MMSFGEKIFSFYTDISIPVMDNPEVDVMLPFTNNVVRKINEEFYRKYYNDNLKRVFLIGINPGRFGGGVTGIPFTDPMNLQEILGIKNTFTKKHELSSQFVYSVIKKLGGPEQFFGSFYLTAVSPVGFVMNNKNINYYEVKQIKEEWEPFFVDSLKNQIQAGGNKAVAFMIGQGENARYLNRLNGEYHFFEKLIPLPHPRWIMQYRYRSRDEFVHLYIKNLRQYIRN